MENAVESIVSRRPKVLIMRLRTPTMVIYKGQTELIPEVHVFVRNLARKYSLLKTYQFEDEPLSPEEVEALVEAAQLIKIEEADIRSGFLRRYSLKRQRWEKYGPFITGTLVSSIDRTLWTHPKAQDLLRILLLGTIIHVGKFPTAGCGAYELRFF